MLVPQLGYNTYAASVNHSGDVEDIRIIIARQLSILSGIKKLIMKLDPTGHINAGDPDVESRSLMELVTAILTSSDSTVQFLHFESLTHLGLSEDELIKLEEVSHESGMYLQDLAFVKCAWRSTDEFFGWFKFFPAMEKLVYRHNIWLEPPRNPQISVPVLDCLTWLEVLASSVEDLIIFKGIIDRAPYVRHLKLGFTPLQVSERLVDDVITSINFFDLRDLTDLHLCLPSLEYASLEWAFNVLEQCMPVALRKHSGWSTEEVSDISSDWDHPSIRALKFDVWLHSATDLATPGWAELTQVMSTLCGGRLSDKEWGVREVSITQRGTLALQEAAYLVNACTPFAAGCIQVELGDAEERDLEPTLLNC